MTDAVATSVAELTRSIETGWNAFRNTISTLTENQLTQPTDAAGWTAKDHLIHLATWEDALNALLDLQPRWENLGIDKALWDSQDIDQINAVIQKRYHDMPLADVHHRHQEVHQRLMAKIAQLSDKDLQKPIKDYQPGSTDTTPIGRPLVADTYEAYAEHMPWIAAIVAKA